MNFDRLWFHYLYVAVTVPSVAVAILHGPAWVVPTLQASLFFPLFFRLHRQKHFLRLFALTCFWSALTSAVVIVVTVWYPLQAEHGIFRAAGYRDEMFTWIATGVGSEADIRQFLPQLLTQLLLFGAACLLSLGFLGLCLGAALLNYMSFYVGALYLKEGKAAALLLGWPPWALLRVAGFIAAAIFLVSLELRMWDEIPSPPAAGGDSHRKVRSLTVAARFLSDVLSYWKTSRKAWRELPFSWLWLAMGLIVGDIALKFLLAGWWRRLLLRFVWV
ncbi:MAG TPA: hypothetical protein VGQ81_04175 [Acidobacteriota bacterium]|nr:hypothetical protein [Acidobacteriota bacterium]